MIPKSLKPVAVVVLLASSLFAQFSGKQGDFWTGGSFNFMSVWQTGSNSSEKVVVLSPMLRFFPATGLCLGPKISWTGLFPTGASQNVFGLGMELGYLGGASPLGYIVTSPHFAFMSENYSSSYGLANSSYSSQAFFLPFTAGAIIPAWESLGIQFEFGYSVGFNLNSSQSPTANAITIGVGLCGLGQRVALSVVNAVNLMSSAF